jgi:hypothetical protein
VAATGIEARAVRRFAPDGVRVVEAGIALARGRDFDDLAISCGLAGGLRRDLPTGTVLIPRRVRRPDNTEFECDAHTVASLTNAARALGHHPISDPLATTAAMVHGVERGVLASQGYAGVDMETGLLRAPRVACVRVILDTPQYEISPAWMRLYSVILNPRAWLELPFLMREGPRCSTIAAKIAAKVAANVLLS